MLLNECIEGLNIKKDGVYVDCTLGGAGHSSEIAKKLCENGLLIGIDKDETALEVSNLRLKDAKCRVELVHSDFKDIKEVLKTLNIEKVDGILADLGVSSYQIDTAERGFSYNKDAILDMRMDSSSRLSAYEIVNTYSEKELTRILFDYGEESFAKKIARNIVENRPITTTFELKTVVEKSYPPKLLHKGTSVCKKTFQALRIETNGELENLNSALENMIDCLNVGGRLCVITFHSLEDRIAKQCFNKSAQDCLCPKNFPICVCGHKASVKLVNKKPIIPSDLELENNKRSTSSKLRIIEKL